MDVTSSIEGRFIGIRQSAETQGTQSFIIYTYSEPVVKIQVLDGFPAVNFNRFTANITLADGTVMPQKDYPLSKGTGQNLAPVPGQPVVALPPQELDIQFPILSSDRDLQSVVFPGNNAPRVRDGRAEIVLFGKDLNGNDIQVPLSVPLAFESTVFSDSITPPTAAPSPSPNASPNPSPTSGGQ